MHKLNRLAELLEDWEYLFRRDGVRSALPVVGLEITRLPYRHVRLFILVRSLAEPLPHLQPRISLDIYPFEPSHLDLVRAVDLPSHAKLCERRLESEHYGLVALHNGRAAGFAWGYCPMDWEQERVHLQLEPGDILCDDAFTVPSLGGKGVQTALTLERFRMFRDLGYRRAISYIEIHNSPSLAVWQRKFGAQIAGEIDFLRIGPWDRVHCSWIPIAKE